MWIWIPAFGTAFATLTANTWQRITAASKTTATNPADAILVFGAGLWQKGPSLTMRVRVDEAARLYEAGLAPVILCSSGFSGDVSEASVMRSLLLERGIPAGAVIADDHGISTRHAIRAAKRFGRGRWRNVIAVSSPYHLHRVAQEARRQGLVTSTSAARRPGPATWRHTVFDARQRLREVLAVWWYAASAAANSLAGQSLPARACRHLGARVRFLTGDADDVAVASDKIGHYIKSRIAGFSDTQTVHTPASGVRWPTTGQMGDTFGIRHGRLHAGVDIRTALGTPVGAAAGGHVLFAGLVRSYGNVVVVHHGGGLATVYAHLASFVVDEGAAVAEGQLVGYVGETGRSSGPHLHFEVRVHGSPVDPLVYLSEADAIGDYERHGQHNAAWVDSIYLRGHDPKKPQRLLTDRLIASLADRLTAHGIRYAYLFAGPFDADGRVPDYAFSPTARATVATLKRLAPDLIVLPWLGGLQHLTVHLEDPQWTDRAVNDTARLLETLEVSGVHLDIEFILPDSHYVLAEQKLTATTTGLDDYGTWHVSFHKKLRERLPDAFISSVIPSTSTSVRPWKKQHSESEAAALTDYVDQLSVLHYDTSIADRETFRASLVEQLTHIARWKRRPSVRCSQFLLGAGTFVNARPLRTYRHLDVEALPHYFAALEQAIAGVHDDIRLVDGIALFCDWTTTGAEWRRFRRLWVNGAR